MTWDDYKAVYDALYKADPTIRSLIDKMTNSKITYEEAHQYAIRIGETLSKTMWNTGALSGVTEEDVIRSILEPALRNNYELASQASAIAQQAVNDESGIGIKAVLPKLKEDRINGIVGEVMSKGYDQIVQSFDDQMVNFSQAAVDDTIQSNAWLHSKAGLSPKIVRVAEAGACRWCRSVAGTYDYTDVKDTGNDVFRRHENCRCITEYKAEKNGKQVSEDVWKGQTSAGVNQRKSRSHDFSGGLTDLTKSTEKLQSTKRYYYAIISKNEKIINSSDLVPSLSQRYQENIDTANKEIQKIDAEILKRNE